MIFDDGRGLPPLSPEDLLPADLEVLGRIAELGGKLGVLFYRPYGALVETRPEDLPDGRLWVYVPGDLVGPARVDIGSLAARFETTVRSRLERERPRPSRLVVHTGVASPRPMIEFAHEKTRGGVPTLAGCLHDEHEDLAPGRRPRGIEQVPDAFLDALADEIRDATGTAVARATIVRYHDPRRPGPRRRNPRPDRASPPDPLGYWFALGLLDPTLVTLDEETATWVRTPLGRRSGGDVGRTVCSRLVLSP